MTIPNRVRITAGFGNCGRTAKIASTIHRWVGRLRRRMMASSNWPQK